MTLKTVVQYFIYLNYLLSWLPFFTDMEADDSQEMVKDSPKTILLIVLVGILGTITVGLIGALIFVAKRKRQSGNEPSLLVHEE